MSEIEERIDFEAVRIGALAKQICAESGFSRLFPEVYAVAMLRKLPNSVSRTIEALGGNLNEILERCTKAMTDHCKVFVVQPGQYNNISTDESCLAMSRSAEEYRSASGAQRVGLIHILLGILKTNRDVTSAFVAGGVSLQQLEGVVRTATQVIKSKEVPTGNRPESVHAGGNKPERKPTGDNPLNEFCVDLTLAAAQGKLDPVVGRETEVNRIITTLCRKKKNNPLLIGEQGTGKTAVVEGLAQRIVSGNVPPSIVGRRIYALNLSAMVANTRYRGQFEEQMHRLLDFIRKMPDAILFIDEAHTLIGAGSAEGSLDASNMMKPALARGGFCCIAATTEAEYKKYFKKDKALDRRFQRIPVGEPTAEQTLGILKGLRLSYEQHHRCKISDGALAAAVEFSGRHISDRFFPDKAIDVMDEMCARFGNSGKPLEREHAAKTVADQMGAPLEIVLPTDVQREALVRDELKRLVVGQDAAIDSVSKAVRRAFSALRDPMRPLASLIFGGPTSVGKTYVAQIMSKQLYANSPVIRINMAEYTEKHNVSRLIGSPPGYVGHGDRNQLTDRVMRHPHSVVLFDNIDKAHPDVLHVIMEMMDAGVLTDGEGNEVSFRSAFIILTTTAGVDGNSSPIGFGGAVTERDIAKQRLTKACSDLFGDEFLYRVDDLIPFLPLATAGLRKVGEYALAEISKRLEPSVKFTWNSGVLDRLATAPNARAVRSMVKNEIETVLCEALAAKASKIILAWDGDKSVFAARTVAPPVKADTDEEW